MAHLVLQHAFGKVEGVSVDVHVHRICNRLQWAGKNYETRKDWKPCKSPGETAGHLEEWVPKEKWTEVNHMLVGFGQTVCRPLRPLCYECTIIKMCPFTDKNMKVSKVKVIKENEVKATEKRSKK